MYSYLDIKIYSHFFKIFNIDSRITNHIYKFIKRYTQYGLVRDINGKMKYAPIKVYGASDKFRSEYRFHINALDEFIEFLTQVGIELNQYKMEYVSLYSPEKINVKMNPGWIPRDYQTPMIKYFENKDRNSKFLDLQTGKGKSYIATQAIVNMGLKTIIIVRPLFIEKWGQDLIKMTNVKPKDILVVQGNNHFKGLVDLAMNNNLENPFIILSNKTLQAFISRYELDPKASYEEYGFYLEDLYQMLGVGIKLVDEIHLDFHLNFKIEMYTHIPYTFGLSATLFHDDPFIEKMYKVMFPLASRYNTKELDKYINSYAILYNQDYNAKIKTHEFGVKNYSHHAYEKSIMKNPKYLKQYMELIKYCVDRGFINDYKYGEKLAIYVSSIKMATSLTEYLKQQYADLDVRRYVEDDPYENLLDPDIRITTIMSGGTGHDISNLKMVLLTVAISSSQSNVQTLGRLRKLDDIPVRFYYLTNLNVKKHVEYHEKKKEMLLFRAKTYKEFFYPDILFKMDKRY